MLYDVTVPISTGLPTWPGDPVVELERPSRMEEGGYANLSRVALGSHNGTHVDAPFHFVPKGEKLWEIPIERWVGPCWVADCRGAPIVTAEMLEGAAIPPDTTRLLFLTDNSAHWDDPTHDFHEGFVALSKEGAEWVRARGIELVGIDYASIDAFGGDGSPAHNTLLPAGILIIENLDLRAVPPNRGYELLCLPLPLAEGGDGAPARVLLRDEDPSL